MVKFFGEVLRYGMVFWFIFEFVYFFCGGYENNEKLGVGILWVVGDR